MWLKSAVTTSTHLTSGQVFNLLQPVFLICQMGKIIKQTSEAYSED